MIAVTKTFLPPLEEYSKLLSGVWERGWVTNEGPLVEQLEDALKHQLRVKHLFFVSNGTLALQLAIKALDLRGEIITTPFSYVATTSSIVWENCRPVYVDISPNTLCLNPELIEAAITPATSAILATHVFGTPCDVETIARIARRHNLQVIYDAAHTFGANYLGRSVVSYGDVSTLSFHATKLFHTGEGGAVVTDNDEVAHRIGYMRNFGHNGPNQFVGLGINAKNSELHAAMGLSMLPYVPHILERRRRLSAHYRTLLTPLSLQEPALPTGTEPNHSYFPVLFNSEEQLIAVVAALNAEDIFPRRYFHPVLTSLPYLQQHCPATCPVAHAAASRVLCLPLYQELAEADVEHIVRIITAVCQ